MALPQGFKDWWQGRKTWQKVVLVVFAWPVLAAIALWPRFRAWWGPSKTWQKVAVVAVLGVVVIAAATTPEDTASSPTADQQTSTTVVATTAPAPDTTTSTTSTTSTTTLPPTTTTLPPTGEDAIEAAIQGVLGDSYIEGDVIEQVDGGYGVKVTMSMSDNLTMGLTAGGFEIDAADVMIALFAKNPQLEVKWVAIDGMFPLTDQYGNTEPGKVVAIRFQGDEAAKVNWDADDSSLALSILPGLYEWLIIHPELADHLP